MDASPDNKSSWYIDIFCIQITLVALRLVSNGLKAPITLDLSTPESIAKLKGVKTEVTIKEGAEYAVEIEFKVSGGLCSGLKYLQVAKRGGIKVDKIEQMIGSYGPHLDSVVKRFPPEEAPSGKSLDETVFNMHTYDSQRNRYACSRDLQCANAFHR